MARNPLPAGHWATAWVNIPLALARASEGRSKEAIALLRQSLVVGGRLDHPLTATALLELGKLHLEQQQLAPAAESFFEATFPAAYFGQADVLEEAFRLAAEVHRLREGKEVLPALLPAAAWASSSSPIAAPSFSTRSARSPYCSRPSCCGLYRSGKSNASAATGRSRSTYG